MCLQSHLFLFSRLHRLKRSGGSGDENDLPSFREFFLILREVILAPMSRSLNIGKILMRHQLKIYQFFVFPIPP